MAEETLVKEALTEEMKSAGAALTRELDDTGWRMVASFWYFESSENRWKLVLASPRVSADGPKKAYDAVAQALEALHESFANLEHITVVGPDHPLIKTFASAIQTGWTIGGIRFSRKSINGHFVEDAYLYRIASESAAA